MATKIFVNLLNSGRLFCLIWLAEAGYNSPFPELAVLGDWDRFSPRCSMEVIVRPKEISRKNCAGGTPDPEFQDTKTTPDPKFRDSKADIKPLSC